MNYKDEREVVGDLLATWSHCPVFYPNVASAEITASNDPSNPSSFICIDFQYLEAELLTFGGTSKIDGLVVFSIWQEKDSGDEVIRGHVDNLRSMFKTADTLTDEEKQSACLNRNRVRHVLALRKPRQLTFVQRLKQRDGFRQGRASVFDERGA